MAKPLLSPIEQYIVDVVKRKREALGWSQNDLAIELDVTTGFIGNVENPKVKNKYTFDHINKLAEIFKCSPRDFLPEHFL